ncbi:flagellar hook-associated protein 3 [Rhodanobacter glycinis]|uniref:Flagellar hook-associated protein 3 n=1 Tax=Rhodanobacter glycinis TaxID=582702 RepID=A0A502C2H2_9GAMM|nr:flagellar hook-associated protein FlgL [Rhodanobacter glycinis]TPG07377.1 flagellar hook-associated protein 3 [Rhodanobacter glycinis]TPG46220.1 flagellar hook-associated protein 3 [Rhodanobacter glycinis]
MRVSTSWIQQQSVGSMMDRQSDLSDINTQLSTGKRINQPSDDPVGAARALDLSHLTADTAQYQRNITSANARLGLEDQSLSNTTNVLDRVRTLLLEAANGTQSDGTRGDIAAEMVQLRQQLLGQANGKDGQGDYIFAGNRTGTEPFASQNSVSYLGDNGQRMVAAGAGLQVATGDPGSAVFVDIPTGNGTFAISADPANTGTAVAGASSVSNPNASPSAWDGGNYSIVFTAANAYEVRDGGGAVLDSGSYDATNGGSITFRGAQVAFSGAPAVGDKFALGASTKQDMFTTLDNIINTLRTPNGGGAQMQNNINTQFANLDQAIDNITRTRGMVGARMNALDQQSGLNDDLTLQYKSALTDVQDVNYYDAISQLGAQTTALQAAQQTFTKIQGSKLFDYLR